MITSHLKWNVRRCSVYSRRKRKCCVMPSLPQRRSKCLLSALKTPPLKSWRIRNSHWIALPSSTCSKTPERIRRSGSSSCRVVRMGYFFEKRTVKWCNAYLSMTMRQDIRDSAATTMTAPKRSLPTAINLTRFHHHWSPWDRKNLVLVRGSCSWFLLAGYLLDARQSYRLVSKGITGIFYSITLGSVI